MEQIAQRLGFSELSAFSRAFKRWFGKSPRAFRRSSFPPTTRADDRARRDEAAAIPADQLTTGAKATTL